MARIRAGCVIGLLAGKSRRRLRSAFMDFEHAAAIHQAQAVFGNCLDSGRGINALPVSRVVGGYLYHAVEGGRIDSILRQQVLGGNGRVKPGVAPGADPSTAPMPS